MSDENNILLAIIAEVREALGTPDNASVVQHARDVVAEAQACREDLATAVTALAETTMALERVRGDYGTAFNLLQAAQVDARRWRALMRPGTEVTADIVADAEKWLDVPWDVVGRIAYPPNGWPENDDVFDLRTWYDRSKPQEVQA